MILCLSEYIYPTAIFLGKFYKEKVANFGPGCFAKNLVGDDERLTCIGHGTIYEFGENDLEPKQFIADLISFGLPTQIDTIDLLSCEVGEVRNNTSYARKVAEELFAQGYEKIQVNAFSNLIMDESVASINLLLNNEVSFILTGLASDQSKKKFNALLSQPSFVGLKKTLDGIENNNAEIKSEIRKLLLNQQDSSENRKAILEKKILDNKKEKIEIEKNFLNKSKEIESERAKLETSLLKINNVRVALDFNPNFHHTKLLSDQLKKLTAPRRTALAKINNRIAELQHEVYKVRGSSHFNFFVIGLFSLFVNPEPQKDLHYQLKVLRDVAKIMQNPFENLDSVYHALGKIYHDEKFNNRDNAALIESILNIFNISVQDIKLIYPLTEVVVHKL